MSGLQGLETNSPRGGHRTTSGSLNVFTQPSQFLQALLHHVMTVTQHRACTWSNSIKNCVCLRVCDGVYCLKKTQTDSL